MGFPLGSFPTEVGLRGGWWSIGPMKKQIINMASFKKKPNVYQINNQKDHTLIQTHLQTRTVTVIMT